ncbi:MAG: hypothetical protein ACLFQT_09880, partial [Thiohalophilus sp.]
PTGMRSAGNRFSHWKWLDRRRLSGAFSLVRFVVALQRNEPEARWRVSAFEIQARPEGDHLD